MRIRVLIPLLLLLLPSVVLAESEEIISYNTVINVRQDGDLDIRESITVRAMGRQIKRGIYRDFPTKYKTRLGRNVVVDFDVLSVERDGVSEPYHLKSHGNGIRVYIGDKNHYLGSGVYTYDLEFQTSRQLGFHKNFDELYFNAIGHGWVFPIQEARVVVNLPPGISSEKVFITSYRGKQGSNDQTGVVQNNLAGSSYEFLLTRPLGAREGLTISVQFPKGFVAEPSFGEKLAWFISDNSVTLVAIIGVGFLFGYYYIMWTRYGRDPDKGVIIPQYAPPEGLTPWGMRYLMRMKFDPKCLACALTSMAIKGHVVISEIGKKFSVTTADIADKKGELGDVEHYLLAVLFQDGSTFTFDKEDHAQVRKLLSSVEDSAKTKHLKKNLHLNRLQFAGGILILVLTLGTMGITAAIFFQFMFSILNIILIVAAIVAIVVFEFLMKAPTKTGRELMDRIEGYKMYLNTAEDDRLKRANFDNFTSEVFEQHLPYAMALDVEDNWAKFFMAALASAGREPSSYRPRYYHGRNNWYSSRNSFNSMSSGISSAIASSSNPPGSSSGGGGGGFSGGGGGGGGGGGW